MRNAGRLKLGVLPSAPQRSAKYPAATQRFCAPYAAIDPRGGPSEWKSPRYRLID